MNPDGQFTATSVENLLFTCWAKLTVMQQTCSQTFFFHSNALADQQVSYTRFYSQDNISKDVGYFN